MPTFLTHPAVPLAARLGLGRGTVSGRLLAAAVACSILPDVDSIGFFMGIPYGSPIGHRGLTHSLLFALVVALASIPFAPALRASRRQAFLVILASTASHGLLDALTNGGLGIGFLIPFSNERFFFPWRPLAVAPIGIAPFFSAWGVRVLVSEIRIVWIPLLALGLAGRAARRYVALRGR